MKREYLSLEDHRKVADELRSIEAAWSRIFTLCACKVPVGVLMPLATFGKSDRLIFRFREDCYKEMRKRHRQAPDIYFNDPSGDARK